MDGTPGHSFRLRVMRAVRELLLVPAASDPCSELAYVSDMRQASSSVDDDSLPESEIVRHMCKEQHQQRGTVVQPPLTALHAQISLCRSSFSQQMEVCDSV
ncbi:hypothetical protein NQZ68_037708 [Dissostichus eleginoides]|nr:hypothetical protein NQZ68_037708 [Dissostichus eleginoides]